MRIVIRDLGSVRSNHPIKVKRLTTSFSADNIVHTPLPIGGLSILPPAISDRVHARTSSSYKPCSISCPDWGTEHTISPSFCHPASMLLKRGYLSGFWRNSSFHSRRMVRFVSCDFVESVGSGGGVSLHWLERQCWLVRRSKCNACMQASVVGPLRRVVSLALLKQERMEWLGMPFVLFLSVPTFDSSTSRRLLRSLKYLRLSPTSPSPTPSRHLSLCKAGRHDGDKRPYLRIRKSSHLKSPPQHPTTSFPSSSPNLLRHRL